MNSLGDRQQLRESAPEKADLHRLLRTVVQVVEHRVLAPTRRAPACASRRDLDRRAFALRALADVT
jgi:hypothetical protein